jgi:F0F1-type ATP synthase assembly protein I
MAKENALFTYGRYAALGFEFAAAAIAGIYLGSFIDSRFGTGPWGVLLGSICGLAGAIYRLVIVLPKLVNRREPGDNQNN